MVARDNWGRQLRSPHGLRAAFAPPSAIAGFVDARDVKTKVEEKVSKYRSIVERYCVPLVVSVGADTFTGLSLVELDDLLAGQPKRTVQFNFGDWFIDEEQVDLARPPRWDMSADLAGLLWISNRYPFRVEASRPNPGARRPMPEPLVGLSIHPDEDHGRGSAG
jgi:hypothetical protein